MTRVHFLIEATETSGLGRVRRSAVLAKAMTHYMKLSGISGTVTAAKPESKIALPVLRLYGIPLQQVQQGIDPDATMIVIDGGVDYQLSIMDSLPKTAEIIVIDDIANCRLAADVIVNPNIYAAQLDYSYLGHPRLLCGPVFHLIDPTFFPKEGGESNSRDIDVLISFGGADTEDYIRALTTALAPKARNLTVRIASPFPLNRSSYSGIPVLIGEDMNRLLKRSRLYAGGAGATALEALASGCKILVTRAADDQGMNVLSLRMSGVDVSDPFNADSMTSMIINNLASPKEYDISLHPKGVLKTAKALLS